MPIPSAIVLADAQATPVNHTFDPTGRDSNGIYWYTDVSAANAVGYWRISVEIKHPPMPTAGVSAEGRTNRVRLGLHEPVLEALSNNSAGFTPAPTVAYVSRCFVEFVLPERASLQNRKDLRKMVANLLANSQMIDVIEDLEYLG